MRFKSVFAASAVFFALAAAEAPQAAGPTLGVAIMSAFVSDQGMLIRGAGVVSATKYAEGRYEVTFNRAVDTCSAVASVNLDPGIASTEISAGSSAVVVRTRSVSTANFVDLSFQLIVFCAK